MSILDTPTRIDIQIKVPVVPQQELMKQAISRLIHPLKHMHGILKRVRILADLASIEKDEETQYRRLNKQ
ncbi:hypothetical protein [Nitrosomonas ureae]|nr:hypothetical protein [Nitrosomonas ureae]